MRYAGKYQRCWTHLLRDLHDLKGQHPIGEAVLAWAAAVGKGCDEASTALRDAGGLAQEDREALSVWLVAERHALGQHYAWEKAWQGCALAKHLLRYEDELFQFALVDGVDATNNLAERVIRPLMIIRKISGGSRSTKGTNTRMTLASLLGTWQLRSLNPFEECFTLLLQTA